MNIFSLILIILSVLYVFLGSTVIRLDKRSQLNRLYFVLNLSLLVWSLATAFFISASDMAACIFWDKLSTVGCILYIGIVLHFFLVYAKKENLLKHWWMYIILYLPSIILSYMEITVNFYAKAYFHGSNGWIITARTDSMWFWAFIAYIVVYVSFCIFINFRLQKTAIAQRERKQARVLFVTSAASLLAGLGFLALVSILELDIPDVTPISIAIWSIGLYYAIVKYKMMAMTPSFIAENLFQTIIDSVILTNT